MSIAVVRIRVTLDQSSRRDWHRPWVGLTLICNNPDRNFRLSCGVNHLVWNTDRTSAVESGAEIGMQRRGSSDKGNNVSGVRIDWHPGDVGIPRVIARERNEAVKIRAG